MHVACPGPKLNSTIVFLSATALRRRLVINSRMTRMAIRFKKPASEPGADTKVRKCLVCEEDFESQWAGERICRKCKSSAAWRSG